VDQAKRQRYLERPPLALALLLTACSAAPPKVADEPAPPSTPPPTAIEAADPDPGASQANVVAAPDRSEADRALDAGRHPAETLTFFGIAPGMRVAELMAGTGYTAELLARAVGPQGQVYGQNNAFVLDKFAEEPWSERLSKPVNARIVRVDRELEAPLPPEATDLDAVFLVLFYHDAVWMKTDRQQMNAAIFAALKPGGIFAVIDHSAQPGAGLNDVKTLHRIEESVVRTEVEAAGFRLDAEASFLRNPDDPRDWNAAPSAAGERRGTSDRFVLRFVKPTADPTSKALAPVDG